MTYNRIAEIRRGLKSGPSLQRAASQAGLTFVQCSDCRGAGYVRATLLVSSQALYVLAKECSDEPIPVQYDCCGTCGGSGGWIQEE